VRFAIEEAPRMRAPSLGLSLASLSWVALVALVACQEKAEEKPAASSGPLRVSAIPDEAPTELIKKFEPLGKYLEKKIGIPVQFTPVTDYAATVEGLAGDKLDLVWYGGFTLVQAHTKNPKVLPLVQREEDAHFHSKFIAGKNTGITKLEDLKGRTFSFGSVSSTSGHLMPRHFLLAAGIDPEKDFKAFSFSGAHDATVKAVESGSVDAGALNESVWAKLLADKKVDLEKVQEFWTTPDYYDYNWTIRGNLPPELIAKVKAAFLDLDPANPEHKAILDLQRASKYVETKIENYEGIEKAARAAGLLK
jgi:phosphonate transport system substrate-binding protein